MKKCGLKTDIMTNRCLYQSGDMSCLFPGSCYYLPDPPNCDSSVQKPPTSSNNAIKPKSTLEERAKQDCSSCDHKTVCKYKEKFETIIKEHLPLLCVCQWYKKEEDHS